jgi:hypothetical protein
MFDGKCFSQGEGFSRGGIGPDGLVVRWRRIGCACGAAGGLFRKRPSCRSRRWAYEAHLRPTSTSLKLPPALGGCPHPPPHPARCGFPHPRPHLPAGSTFVVKIKKTQESTPSISVMPKKNNCDKENIILLPVASSLSVRGVTPRWYAFVPNARGPREATLRVHVSAGGGRVFGCA